MRGLPRRAPRRLGLPRPAGRDRRREAARASRPRRRSRSTASPSSTQQVPRVGVHVPRGLERAHRADRLLARPRRRLPHARPDLRRVGLVGAQADRRQGPALRGPQGRPVLPALRHRAVEPRGRARLQGRQRPVGLRALPGRAGRRPAAGRRRAARLDDDAVDARLQRRRRGRSRARSTCARRPARSTRRSCSPRRSSSACSATAPTSRSSSASRARRSTACATSRRSATSRADEYGERGHTRPARRLRHRRRRHRHRPHRDRLRRGRLPARRSSTA